MPKREDEYWKGEKEELRYCSKHKRYYRADIGCHLCAPEKSNDGNPSPAEQQAETPRLQKCPNCKQVSLFWNQYDHLYECLNKRCRRAYSEEELRMAKTRAHTEQPRRPRRPRKARRRRAIAGTVRTLGGKTASVGWLSLRTITRTLRPSWRKRKFFSGLWRVLPKALILVFVLAIAAIVTSTICQFVTADLQLTAVIILGVAGLAIVIWGLRSMSRYRVRFARFFMVALISILFLIVSSTYLGIRSPTDIKDNVIDALTTEAEEFRSTVDLLIQRTELKVVDIAKVIQSSTTETPQEAETAQLDDVKITTQTDEPSAGVVETIDTSKYVLVNGGILVGADGDPIILQNNENGTNPSWNELKAFLLKDETDGRRYDLTSFVCADFAEMLHNNAEAAGIRAAYVGVWLGPCSYYPRGGGHALNAFETTDRGLVFVDCTGSNAGINSDKVVVVEVGRDYIPRSIFPTPGWNTVWANMGKVERIETIQW